MAETIRVQMNAAEAHLPCGVTVGEAVRALLPADARQVLGVMRSGECLELTQPL
jgi:hypothetical protein